MSTEIGKTGSTEIGKTVVGLESFSEILKSDPSRVVEKAFIKAERQKKGGEKTGFFASMRHNTIVSKLTVRRYMDITTGKAGSAPRKYIDEVELTEGNYGKRDSKIRYSVKAMYDLITKSKGKSAKFEYTILDLYTRLYKMVAMNSKWADAFGKAYKLHKRGSSSATMIFMKYVFMVYAMESLALMLREYCDDITSGNFDSVNNAFCVSHKSFVSATADNVIPVLVSCENTNDPKKYVDGVVKIEKTKESNESEDYLVGSKHLELDNVSSEDAIGAALLYGALSVAIAVTVIHGMRYIIYSISCLTVDISKSLIDQSYTLLVSIEHLEIKLSSLKPGSKEYRELENTINKQKEYTSKLIDIAEKLSGDDVESLDEIRKKEYDDDKDIENSPEEDDDSYRGGGGNSGGLDI